MFSQYPCKTVREPFPTISITLGDAEYPERLGHISDPPRNLYCRGNIALLKTFCFGVVGTRKMTPYGKEVTRHITSQLANQGYCITSGLALGVDTTAHQATLDVGGKTIAILGTGIDDATIFPPNNLRLAHDILQKGGLIISEYPEGAPGLKHQFPARNRIISGLSHGVLIIEADQKSGALITAKCALDQNRDVFAIPGNIFSPRSIGSNLLIQQGAKLVLTAQDILSEYSEQLSVVGSELSVNLSTQDPVQKKILAILTTNGPMHIDTIITQSELQTPMVSAALSLMEIKSIVKHIGNGIYKTR